MRVQFNCKGCGREMTADYTRPGKTAQCAGCHLTQEIPGDAAAPQFSAGKPAATPSGGGGGGSGGMIKLIVLLAALAAVAWFLHKKGVF